MALQEILINKIYVGKGPARTRKVEAGLDELKESIKRFGLLHPIVVFPKDDRYELVAGSRRLLAVTELGWKKIPAMVISPLDAAKAKIISLTEHIQRRELSHADIVDAIEFLYNRYGSIGAVAEELGFSEAWVRRYLSLALAPDSLKKMIEERKIRVSDARKVTMIAYPDEEKMLKIAQELVKLTSSEKRRLIDIAAEKPKASAEELIKEAKRPPVVVKISIHLPPKYEEALRRAAEDLGITYEDLLSLLRETLLKSK